MNKKLKLNRETIRTLDVDRLGSAAGGISGAYGRGSVEKKCSPSAVLVNTCISENAGDCNDTSAYPSLGC